MNPNIASNSITAAPSPTKSSISRPPGSAARLAFIDNIRWVMIILVLSMHAAVTYSTVGSWYYRELPQPDKPELIVFVTYQLFLQSFFMGLLFFIAGYFVPGAYDRKGPARFLKDRAFRLGMPSLLYIFIIGPLTEYYISRTWAGDSPDRSFLREYGHYLTRVRFPGGSGPLWFCVALLLFCCGYTGWRVLVTRPTGKNTAGTPRPFPGAGKITVFIGLIGVATFFVRMWWPNGSSFYNMQFGYFSQYIAFFIAGTLAYRNSWLTTLSAVAGKRWGFFARIGGLITWFALLIGSGALQGHVAELSGGWHWQSFGMCVWEAMVGIGLSIWVLAVFRSRFNRQGRWASFFSDNAFAVYVFHPPVLIAITLGMEGLHAPALLKFLLATALSVIVSFTLAATVLRRIPVLKRII